MTKKTMKLKTILETTSFNKFSEQTEEMQENHDSNPQKDIPLESLAERKVSVDCCNLKDIPTRENTPPKQYSDQKSKRKGLKLHSQPFLTRSTPIVDYCLPYNEKGDQMEPTMLCQTAQTPCCPLPLSITNFFEHFPFEEEYESVPEAIAKPNQPVSDFQKKKKTEICRNWKLTGTCKFGSEVIPFLS
jgi:hypothetical protein